MVPYKVHLHNQYGEIVEEGIWYRFGENTLLRFDDPIEMRDFAESILKDEDAVISEWRNYEAE